MASRIFPGVGTIKGGWSSGEDGWGNDLNNNLFTLSVLAQIVAIAAVDSLPVVVADGEIYLLKSTAAANPTMIAARDDGMWRFIQPKDGWRAYCTADATEYRFQATDWVPQNSAAAIPAFNAGLANYQLAVNPFGTGVVWVPPYDPTEQVPPFDSGGLDDGKILKVVPGEDDEDSHMEWVEAPLSLPVIPGASAGKVVVINSAGDGLTYEDDGKYRAVAPGYVLTEADFSGRVILGATGNITIPAGIARASTVTIVRASTAEVEVLAAAGVSLNVADGRASLRARWSAVSIVKMAPNSYVMFGDVTQGA